MDLFDAGGHHSMLPSRIERERIIYWQPIQCHSLTRDHQVLIPTTEPHNLRLRSSSNFLIAHLLVAIILCRLSDAGP